MKAAAAAAFVFLALGAAAQQDRQQAIDQAVELLLENLETEEADMSAQLDELLGYYEHPLNLNTASRSELERIFLFSESQISHLIRHRTLAGPLIDVLELQGITGFDVATIAAIRPFVKVGGSLPNLSLSELRENGGHEAVMRWQQTLEPLSGTTEGDFAGDPSRVLMRYRYRYLNHLSVGFTAEKDAGEALGGPTQPAGFDYYSGHAYVGNYGRLKHLVVGDYQVQFGQGLTYWTGLAFGKTTNTASMKRTAREIVPHVSAMEANFQRGAAATLRFGSTEATAFYSRQGIDANVDTATTTETEFSSIQQSGLHRTEAELADRKQITETNVGAHLRYVQPQFQLGVTYAHTNYSGSYAPAESFYRKFTPTDSAFGIVGFDYQLAFGGVTVFGEAASRSRAGNAFLNGALLSLGTVDLSVLHRYYSAGYVNPRSNALAESTQNTNESGVMAGLTARIERRWLLSTYLDVFQFPWLTYRTSAPSSGMDWLGQLEFKPNRRTSAYVRLRQEVKGRNVDAETPVGEGVRNLTRQWLRLNWNYQLTDAISLRNRLEWSLSALAEESAVVGTLFYQDVVYEPKFPGRLSLKARYALFNTPSFDGRIYAYEHDLLYSFSVPAYYGRGMRFYLMADYQLNRWADVQCRISQFHYTDRNTVGSGTSEINGPNKTDLRVQLRLRF